MFRRVGTLSLAVVSGVRQALTFHQGPSEAGDAIMQGAGSTRGEAMAAALNNTRQAALEKIIGVEVRGRWIVNYFQLIDDFVVTATKQLIIEENILGSSSAARKR